jgi:hypothetical protein
MQAYGGAYGGWGMVQSASGGVWSFVFDKNLAFLYEDFYILNLFYK